MDPELEQACGTTPSWVCEAVFDLTDGSRFLSTVADRVVAIVAILLVAWLLTIVARRYLGRLVTRIVMPDTARAARRLESHRERAPAIVQDSLSALLPTASDDPRRDARSQSISAVIGSTAAVLIWAVALIAALGKTGIDLAPLIAGAGIGGIALGFGAQSLVRDCIAGLFVLLEDQYGIGDVVDLDGAAGTVERFSLRSTVLRASDGTVWHVPNGEVRRIGNRSQLWSVAIVDIVVAYDSDLDRVTSVITDTANAVCSSDAWASKVIEPPEVLGVESLDSGGVTVRVITKTEPGVQWRLQRELRAEIKNALDTAGIATPYAPQTVWMRPDASPGAVRGDVADDDGEPA